MVRRFRVSLLLILLLISSVAYLQFIHPASEYEWESSSQSYFTDLTITPDPWHPTWDGNLTHDGNLSSYAYFEYSEKNGQFRLYDFSTPTNVVGSLPDITSVDFSMRYNTTGANTADSPNDMYRIYYYVSPDTTPQVLVDWRSDTYTYLNVDGFDDARKNWTRVGASPYLDSEDYPTNYIHEAMGVLLRPDGDGTFNDWTGNYLDWDEEFIVTNEAVGTGNGITITFNLDNYPLIRGTDRIYLDGNLTREYTIDFNTGTITFSAAPANGVAITADYKYASTHVSAAAPNLNETSTFQNPTPPLPTGIANIAKLRVSVIARNTLSSDDRIIIPVVISGNMYDPDGVMGIQDRYVPPVTYSPLWSEWSKNPATGQDWTWTDVNALEAGVRTKQFGASWTGEIRVAQMFVQVFLTDATIGDFSFQDMPAPYDGGKVFLEIKAKTVPGEIPTRWPEPRDSVKIFVYDGATWQDVGSVTPDTTWKWKKSIDISSVPAMDWALNTTAKINAAKVYLVKETYAEYAAPAADRIEIDAVRLKVLNKDFPDEPAPQVGLPPYPPAYNWTNQAEPNDGTWDWTDVGNINFVVETQRNGGPDPGCRFFMYETWVTVNLPNASLTVRPKDTIDYSLKPQPPTVIRPNADGTKTTWTGTPNNNYLDWADDPTHDGDSSYVYTNSANNPIFGGESSQLQNPTHETWDPAGVRVVAYARYFNTTPMDERLALTLVFGTTEYVSTQRFFLTTDYQRYSVEWSKNPNTGAPWAWTDLDTLQAGVFSVSTGSWTGQIRVTQLYVEIIGPRFDVEIKAENVTNLFSYEFRLYYDTTLLTAIGYSPASPFTSLIVPAVINDTGGWVYVAYSMSAGTEEGASGNRTLGTIYFSVDAFGRSVLELQDIKLSKPNSIVAPIEITYEAYNGYLRNTLLGDIDGNGNVGSSDFSILAGAYGTSVGDPLYDARADIDSNGNVGSSDFSILAGEYGQSV